MHFLKKSFFWTKSLIIELFVFLVTFFLIPIFSRFNLQWVKKGINNRKPIILIHGYLHHSFVWIYHGRRLNKKGFSPIFTLNLKNTFGSIQDHANDLEKKIHKVLKGTKQNEVILIGHSMGGLIASHFAMNASNKNLVKNVITIGSPLKGTSMARFGVGKCAKEMRRGSSFIKDLHEKMKNEKKINFYHIATRTDELVVPFNSAIVLGEDNKHFVLDGLGHASLLYSKKVSDKMSFWLNKIV
jgi:triacylglycerol esterase/lipase EstA (alpha/beta hydrolase family)